MCKREALKKLLSMLLATTVALTSFTIPSFKNSLDASAVSVNTTYYYDGGRVQDWTAPCDGDYTITLKGGDGGKVIHGTITNSAGEVSTGWFYGAGGVTTINAYIKKGETLYMQIGTQGTTDGRGGFNGGGNTTASNAAGGGGCTSVTLESASKLKDIADESKILAVAGGGAGMRNDISNPSGGNNSHSSVSRSYRENTLTNNSTGGNGGGYRTATVGVSWTGDSGIGGAGYAPSGNNNLVKSTNKIYVYNSSVMAGYTFSRTAVSSSDGYVNIKLESEYKSKLTINYGNAAEDRTDEVFCEALNTYEIKKNSIEVDNIQGYSLRGYRIVGDTTNTTHPTTDSIYMTWDDKEITLVWDAQLNVKFTDKMISSTGRTAAEIIFSQDDDRKKTFTVHRSDNGIDFYPAELYNDGTGDVGTPGNYPIWSVSSPGIHGYTTGEEGVYEVVLEGARGGQDTPSNGGGIGGRVQAKVFLWGNRTYYFAVGGAGGDDTQGNGGFNGGGGAGHSGSSGAGGGCTALQMAYGTTAGVGEGNYIAIAGGGGGGNLGSSGGAGGSGGNNGMFAQGSNKSGDGGGGGAGYRGGTEGIDNGGKAQGGSSNVNKSYLVGRASYGTSSRYGHGTASIQFKYPTPKFSGLNTYTKGFYIDDVDSPIIDSAVLNKDTNVVSIVAHDVGSTVTFKVISRDDDGNNIGEATATKNVFAGLKCIYYKVDDVPWCASVPTDNSITNFNDVGSGQFSCSFGLGDNTKAEYIHIVAVDNNDNRSAIQTLELKPKFRIYYSNNYLNYSDDLTMNVFNDIVTVENTRVYGDENTTTLVGAINPSISNYGESNTVKDNVTNNALGDKRYNLKGYKFVGWSKDKLITANTIQPDIPNIEVSSGGLSTPVTILNNTKPVVNYEKDSVILPGKVIPYNYSNPNLVVYMILEPIGYSVNYHSNLASTPLSYKQWFFYDYSSDKLNTLDSKFVHKDSNYEQIGWTKTEHSNKVDYTLGSKIEENLLSTDLANMDVYAVWKKDITLSFNLNGGRYKGSKNNIKLQGTIYNDVTSYKFNIKGSLTPKSDNYYDKQVNDFNCYGVVGVDGMNNNIIKSDSDGINYRFLGWSRDKNATEPDWGLSVFNNNHASTLTIKDDLTLYAVWEPEFVVRYDIERVLGESYNSVLADTVNGEVQAYVVAKPGEQCKYSIYSTGEASNAKVTFDKKITNIYNINGAWTDNLNPNPTTDDSNRVDGIPLSQKQGLDRSPTTEYKTPKQIKFYVPEYLGTKQSEPSSIGCTEYIITNDFYNTSYYSRHVLNKQEHIVIKTHIVIGHDSDSIDTILNDLRVKLKIKLRNK